MSEPSRRDFGRRLGLGLGAAALAGQASAAASLAGQRPNLLFTCSDQHSYKYTGYAGHPLVRTPHLDRIAREGVTFTNAYCGSPVCVPSRASLMTGVFPSDCQSFCNSTVWDGTYPTWGTVLRRAGYRTRASGKLDLNDAFDTGFEEVETAHGHCKRPDITSLFRRPLAYRVNERPHVDGHAREQRHHDARLATVAEEFLRSPEAPSQPWAHYVGFNQPHPSFVALREYWNQYPVGQIDLPHLPEDYLENQHLVFQELRHFKRIATPIPEERIRRARAGYYGMIGEMDEYVGQLLRALEETGQLGNTVVIYTSDHGEALGDHGLWFKNNLLDPAARVPLVMTGAGLPRGKTIDTPVSHVDLVRTLFDAVGADAPEGLRGHSLLPMIEGSSAGGHPGFSYAESHSEGNATGSFLIRKGDWKYLHFTWYPDLLYNVAEDPGEFRNRIDDPAAQSVRKEMEDILRSLVDPEEVTRRGFAAQEAMWNRLAKSMSEDKLTALLAGRLGAGQARALAAKAKS